jgi:Tfp pilus assembly protein PilF
VSRRHGAWLLAAALLVGCASGPSKLDLLRAQNAYERGVNYLTAKPKQSWLALQSFQEAVSIDQKSAMYRDGLGVLLLELGRPDEALGQFQRVVELDDKYANGWFHLGTAQAELRQWDKAVESYQKALTLPTMTVPEIAHQNLGLALYHLKRYREAESAFRLALSLDPEMQAAYYNLGLLFTAEQRLDDARAAFRRASQLGPDTRFGQAAKDRLKDLGEGG